MLFIDSQLVKWNLVDVVCVYKGEKVDYICQKFDVQYQLGYNYVILCEISEVDGKWIVVFSKFFKDCFLFIGLLYLENDQLIDIFGEEMKLVYDGLIFVELYDCIFVCCDQIKICKIWDCKDLFFVEMVKCVEKDGIDLMKDNKVICEGNKVCVYMVLMVFFFGFIEFKVKQGDEVIVIIINFDEIEDVIYGFVMVNYGVCMEISL